MNDLSKELAKNPEYIKRVNDSIGMLESLFLDVKAILDKQLNNDNFNDAFQIFYKIFDVMPVLKNNLPLVGIIRARPLRKGENLCREQWEISYNIKFHKKIELGKFNQKEEPLFYGSLPTDEGLEQQILSASKECCKELLNKYHPPNIQDVTISSWLISKSFNVINLCFDNSHLQYNKELKDGVERFLVAIKDNFSQPAAAFMETFYKYFSELSRTLMSNNENYQLLAPFFIGLRQYSKRVNKEDVFGLMYPGAMTNGKGLNIVLTRDAVDLFLTPKKVFMHRFELAQVENIAYWHYPCSDAVDIIDGKFTITNYMPPEMMSVKGRKI